MIPLRTSSTRPVALVVLFLLAACRNDETVRAYGAADRVWLLQELDGEIFDASATLTFPNGGGIAGQAPCNTYGADMTSPYPWFVPGPIRATKRGCSRLLDENRFFTALTEMTLVEVLGDTLILRTPEGREMVFKAGG